MRDHWEDQKDKESRLDAPVAITERELRSLRRRSRTGIWAMFVALLSVGIALWGILAGSEGRAQLMGLKDRILKETQAEASAGPVDESPSDSGATPDSMLLPPPPSDSLPAPADSAGSAR